MKRYAFKIAGIILMSLMIAIPAIAQQQQEQENIQKKFQDEKTQMLSQQDQMQISGKILKEKTVDIKGKDQKNQVVLLQTAQNKRIIADLGNADALGKVNIKEGKQLDLQGKMVRVSNMPVLLVSQVTADDQTDDQTMDIEQGEIAQRTRKTDMAAMKEKKQIKGTVLSEKNVDLSGQDQQFKVALIELQEGEQVIADLGPTDQLNMEIKQGEQVEIEGNLVRIGNQVILFASSVSAQGQETQIQRDQQQQQQRGYYGTEPEQQDQQMKQQDQQMDK